MYEVECICKYFFILFGSTGCKHVSEHVVAAAKSTACTNRNSKSVRSAVLDSVMVTCGKIRFYYT
jgi:hypothetical protein